MNQDNQLVGSQQEDTLLGDNLEEGNLLDVEGNLLGVEGNLLDVEGMPQVVVGKPQVGTHVHRVQH